MTFSCADETKDSAQHRRTRLKLLANLVIVGIYRDFSILVDTLRHVAAVNFHTDWTGSQASILLLSSFSRHLSDELLGIPSKSIRAFVQEAGGQSHVSFTVLLNKCCQASCSVSPHH